MDNEEKQKLRQRMSEMGKKGIVIRNQKYSREQRVAWAKKGGDKVFATLGRQHFVNMRKKVLVIGIKDYDPVKQT